MTNEERDLIAKFISRIGGAPQGGGFLSGSVPRTQPQLPPIDPEADTFIAQQFQQSPEARYRITQTALVQEGALAEAQNRIRRLEWELQQTQQAMQQQAQQTQQQPQQSRGFLGGLFGGGQQSQQQGYQQRPGASGQSGFQPTTPPPQPQYPPGYQPGMYQQRGGSGFLGSALTTAAGVAGGLVVGNALMGMFSGGMGGLGGMSTAASDPSADAFGGAGSDPTAGFVQDAGAGGDPFAGGDAKDMAGADSGFGSPTSYDQGGDAFAADPGGYDGGFDGGFDGGGSE